MKRSGNEQEEETLLFVFCVEDFAGLKAPFNSLRVKHLRSYTKAELIALVERKGGPDNLVPPFLQQRLSDGRSLESFLCSSHDGGEAAQKKLKQGDVLSTDSIFFFFSFFSPDVDTVAPTAFIGSQGNSSLRP